jgi:ribosome-binding factor A
VSESSHTRSQRVGELLQHELASLITNELKDPRVGFVTVTEVRVSPDLRNARVYVSIYGTPEERAGSLDGLRKAAGYLRHALGGRMQLRYLPELMFSADETLDRADRLQTLMKAIAHGDTATPDAQASAPVAARTDRSDLAERKKTFDDARTKKRGPRRRR